MVRIRFESSALTDAKTATRLDELRAWMASHDLDAALVTRPVSIAYLTGVRVDPHERLMALAVERGRATLILPAIERENAERAKTDADIASWRDGEDPYLLVHDVLEGSVRLGVEKEHMTLAVADVLRERLHTREMFDMAPEIRRLRRTKSPVELEKLAHAAAITDAATEEILSRLHGGQTELEVALAIGASIAAAGGTPAFETIVLSGANSALPHGRPSGQRLREGDLVLLDFGAAYDGYCADTTRVAVVGGPTARQREIHGLVLAAHDAAIEVVRAGATTGDVDSAARKVIEAAGLGDRFFHRTGHGLGLEAHEDPSLDPGSKTVLEVGMVFTVEPGIYIPGWGGVRIEDDVVVEAGGCRLLTKADRSLRAVPLS
ncbi:MAG TPA: peptidase M24 family protein [Chloroflexi bacterium]|jgi:Xaa-Pro dipeptidase|nr:peptidase M24 family protein [Chloroflexota bacterium]HAF18297.1 peptidase M24 family protein [Chloroflexota bacterium]